jgi:hypothetical protein
MKKQRSPFRRPRTGSRPGSVSKEFQNLRLDDMPPGAIKADPSRHVPHNSYSPPLWYVDTRCVCVECGCEFYFTARQQKRWFEQFKIPIHVQANRCVRCRAKARRAKEQQKRHMLELAKHSPHPNKLKLKKVRGFRPVRS